MITYRRSDPVSWSCDYLDVCCWLVSAERWRCLSLCSGSRLKTEPKPELHKQNPDRQGQTAGHKRLQVRLFLWGRLKTGLSDPFEEWAVWLQAVKPISLLMITVMMSPLSLIKDEGQRPPRLPGFIIGVIIREGRRREDRSLSRTCRDCRV